METVQIAEERKDDSANIDIERLRRAAAANRDRLAQMGGAVELRLKQSGRFYLDPARPGLLVDAPATQARARVEITGEMLANYAEGVLDFNFLSVRMHIAIDGDKLLARQQLSALAGGRYEAPPPIDRTALPWPTTDLGQAGEDLARYGYCIVRDALDPDQVARLRDELDREAAHERSCSFQSHTATWSEEIQRLYYIVNGSDEMRELVVHPLVAELCAPILGPHFHCFAFSAIIAHPGSGHQILHMDQQFVQPPVDDAVMVNIGWCLNDLTAENGATRLIPGSHLWKTDPVDPTSPEGTVAAEAPAGSALLFDSRIWHGGGSNRTDQSRRLLFTAMCRAHIRSQDNFFLLLRPEIEERLSPEIKARFGYRTTSSTGSVGMSIEGRIVGRGEHRMTEALAKKLNNIRDRKGVLSSKGLIY